MCFIAQVGFLDILMGSRLHLEVLHRCAPYLGMLVRRGHWTPELTEKLWLAAEGRHSSEVDAVFKILTSILGQDRVGVSFTFLLNVGCMKPPPGRPCLHNIAALTHT